MGRTVSMLGVPRPAGAACCRTGERADPPYGGSLGEGTRREDLRRRIARGIRWRADTVTAPLVADEPVDVSDVVGVVRQQTAQDEEPLASPVVGHTAPGEIPGTSAARCGAWAATSAPLWYPLLPFQRAVATRRSSVAATSAGRGNRER
ncbi:hypothetical protein DKG71_34010 [Streptomyces sp. NEAU-S7GS2]|nr:hypothetical protein DKG71_34010 [Streptomyces sp. NEAU-S7GS2]